jgi:hypothetical protein
MNRREFMASAGAALAHGIPALAQNPPRLRRQDCFFGIHFDLHPNPGDPALGRDVSGEMVERFLKAVGPDYVQYDCKGHVGYLGYPSQVGTSAPHIVNDSLAIWRKGTARHGVGLYIHFSGVWDSRAIAEHPEWATVNADGKRDPNATSTFGPYVDRLMIPELLEAAGKYDLDGAWIDGECWAAKPDYGEAAARAFREATGIPQVPKSKTDPGWREFLEFQRVQFRSYVRHYVDVLHAKRPSFQVASNWLYSTYVPERPDLPVDFLSGDYLGNVSISTARLDGRYLSAVGKPWDLMAWGFQAETPKTGHSLKPAPQLQQEAAVVLAQGGGFQVYYTPTRAGYVDGRNIATMAKVAKFCRARQALSHKSETVPQVGVLFSGHSLYATANKLFGGWGSAADPARGWLDALVDNRYPVDVIPDWRLAEVAERYPLLVVPDWPDIGRDAQKAIAAHIGRGGKTIVAGAENAKLFAGPLGIRTVGDAADRQTSILGDEIMGQARGRWQAVEADGAQTIEQRFPAWDSSRDGSIAATLNGAVAGVYGPIGGIYAISHTAALRQFVRRVVDRLFVPAVKVDGPPALEIALRRKAGKTLLHLVNCSGMQVSGAYMSQDYIPPAGPIQIALRLPARPSQVTLEPEGKPLVGTWTNGTWTGTVDRVDIHSIVVFG